MEDTASLLERAITHCHGNISMLARKTGVQRQHIQNWRKAGRVPPWRLEAVQAVLSKKSANSGSQRA